MKQSAREGVSHTAAEMGEGAARLSEELLACAESLASSLQAIAHGVGR